MYVCINIRIRCVLWRFSCNEVEIKAWLGAKNRGYRKNRHLRTYIVRKAHYHARKRESYYIYIYIERERERERERRRENFTTSSPRFYSFLVCMYVCMYVCERESF